MLNACRAISFARLPNPCLMGIVNITPNSFSDGGHYVEAELAAGHAEALVRAGAGMLDLGAEASSFFRPGVEPVPAEEQIRRLLPVMKLMRDRVQGAVVSVDTRSSRVAQTALEAGAGVINDISGGLHDQEILRVVAAGSAGVILMHMGPAYPATPDGDDPDILGTVSQALRRCVEAARRAGISAERIAVDPGIGFGKTMADNWRLALRAGELGGLGCEVVLGVSRKRFLETPVPGDMAMDADWEPLVRRLRQYVGATGHPRDAATAALTAVMARRGVRIHRVHDVALAARAIAPGGD